jgi:hypothetical protein
MTGRTMVGFGCTLGFSGYFYNDMEGSAVWHKEQHNKRLRLAFLKRHHDKEWNWVGFSNYMAIDVVLFAISHNKPLCWRNLSMNLNISIADISNHADLPWDWTILSELKSIATIVDNPHLPWHWDIVSDRRQVTEELIQSHPNIPWNKDIVQARFGAVASIDYKMLSRNKDLTCDYVEQNIDKDWDWNEIGARPEFVYLIDTYPELAWNWSGFANGFERADFTYHIYRNRAARKIQKWWLKMYYNPSHPVCRTRLFRQYEECVRESG